jgi:hypothetical protein
VRQDSGLKPTNDEHQLIYDALKVHDAKKAMKNHLLSVIDKVFAATEIETVEAAPSQIMKNRERFNKIDYYLMFLADLFKKR